MTANLRYLRVAMLVESGFEQVELTAPRRALIEAGAEVDIVAPGKNAVRGWLHSDWGDWFDVSWQLEEAATEDYDALVLPGGVINADHLRRNQRAVEFVRDFFADGKPVAAICHAPQILIDAEVVRGRHLTSYDSLQADLRNAGAVWSDLPVVIDNSLVTSRTPDDMEHFIDGMLREFARGRQAPSAAPAR